MKIKSARTKAILKVTSFILGLCLNILFYTVVVIAATRLCSTAYDFSYQIFGNVVVDEKPGRDVEIKIQKGESSLNVAKKLELNKVIVDPYSFYVKAKLSGQSFKPGTFNVNSSMNYDEIFGIITTSTAEAKEDTKKDTKK